MTRAVGERWRPGWDAPGRSRSCRGLSWGDYDGDGFINLLGGPTEKTTLPVLRNEGGKHFTDVAAALGLTIPNRSARQSNWIDYDNDGDLDVYTTDRAGDNSLFRNDGGSSRPSSAGAAPTDSRPTVGACWFDMDNDGDLDLFLANQSGATDGCGATTANAFTDVAPAIGMTGPPRTTDQAASAAPLATTTTTAISTSSSPTTVTTSSTAATAMARSPTWPRRSASASRTMPSASTGATRQRRRPRSVGHLVRRAPGAQTPLNALFRNDGAAGFVNVLSKDSSLNVGDHGAQFVDYDNDGGLDLTVTDGYGAVGGHFVFRNTLPDEAKSRSLSVVVLDAKGHQTRFGAEVRLFDAAAASSPRGWW